jgi:hypothetical protein
MPQAIAEPRADFGPPERNGRVSAHDQHDNDDKDRGIYEFEGKWQEGVQMHYIEGAK